MVEDQLFVAIPVGLVHNKDFMRKVLVGKVGAAFCVTIRLELDRPNITCGMLGWMEIWEVSLGWDWFSLDAFEDSILLSLNDLPSTMRFRIVCCLSFRRDISLASCFSKPDLKEQPFRRFEDKEVYSTALQLGLTNLAESQTLFLVYALKQRARIRSNKEATAGGHIGTAKVA